MLTLSEETESLSRRLAVRQKRSVDDTVRHALEQQARSLAFKNREERGTVSEEEVARPRAVLREIQDKIAALPVLDPRPVEEIVDEINEL